MKKEYETPLVEMVKFETTERIMGDLDIEDPGLGGYESVPDDF